MTHCDNPATCSTCAANAKAEGGHTLADWRIIRAASITRGWLDSPR